MNEQSKSNQHLAVVVRYWDILPWHLKAKIVLLCKFYYLRHQAIKFLFGEAKAG
jgi:hypothetical protein